LGLTIRTGVKSKNECSKTEYKGVKHHHHNREQQKKENKHLFSAHVFTGKAILPINFLLVGILVATSQIRGQSKAVVRNKGMKDR
jgi:hypothetical protein